MGFAAVHKEKLKNGPKCKEFGWECILLAVDSYGGWREKTCETFNRTCKRLAVDSASNAVVVRHKALVKEGGWGVTYYFKGYIGCT